MTVRLFFTALLLIVVAACTSTATIEKSWVDKTIHTKEFQGVLVVAIANTEEGRIAFEEEFTAALKKHGIYATASHTVMGGTEIDKEDVVNMAAKAETDTALVTFFAGRDHKEVLNPGRKYYAYAPVYGQDAYGRAGVTGVPYQVGQSSDIWLQYDSIHLQAKLFDVTNEELLWKAFSGMEEQSNIATMRTAFIKSFMKDLADQGLVD